MRFPARRSRIIPPPIPLRTPRTTAGPAGKPASRAISVPTIVKAARPIASVKIKTRPIQVVWRCQGNTRAAIQTTTTVIAIKLTVGQKSINHPGVWVISKSRSVPPPIAVAAANVETPNQSMPARAPATAPEAAKATIPTTVMTRSGKGRSSTVTLFQILGQLQGVRNERLLVIWSG